MTQATRDADELGHSSAVTARAARWRTCRRLNTREFPRSRRPAARTPDSPRRSGCVQGTRACYGIAAGLRGSWWHAGRERDCGHARRAVTEVLPGVLVWRAVRPHNGWWVEDIAMGFAIGWVLVIGAQVIAGLSEQYWIAWSPALLVTLVAAPATRVRTPDRTGRDAVVALVAGAVCRRDVPSLHSPAARLLPYGPAELGVWRTHSTHRRIPASGARCSVRAARPHHLSVGQERVAGLPLVQHVWVAQNRCRLRRGAVPGSVPVHGRSLMPPVVLLAIAVAAVRDWGDASGTGTGRGGLASGSAATSASSEK